MTDRRQRTLCGGTVPTEGARAEDFDYEAAFARNVGWVTAGELQRLRGCRIAIPGMGGVGGYHLLTMTRMGVGAFHVADPDVFELVNFNRQAGASLRTVGQPKVEVMRRMALDINPELDIVAFPEGIDSSNLDAFLDGVDLVLDSLDISALDVRFELLARCAERRIPVVSAGPLGMTTAYLVFLPGGMPASEYYGLDTDDPVELFVRFLTCTAPAGLHVPALVDPSTVDLAARQGPSTPMGCMLCAGAAGVEAVKILLGRGPVQAVPWYHQFDPYHGRWVCKRLPGGYRNPIQRVRRAAVRRMVERAARSAGGAEAATTGAASHRHRAVPRPRFELLEQVLEEARWAPSGANGQPWRFELLAEERVRVRLSPVVGDCYDAFGEATLLAGGGLLEAIALAASRRGRRMQWEVTGGYPSQGVTLSVRLQEDDSVAPDLLARFLRVRSVDRRPYEARPLRPETLGRLERVLGDDVTARWFLTPSERWRVAGLVAAAERLRNRLPEIYEVHRKVVDVEASRSPERVPLAALGLDPVTERVVAGILRDEALWRAMVSTPGAIEPAVAMMGWRPVMASGAVVLLGVPSDVDGSDRVRALLRAGRAFLRLWLTATAEGLALQPFFAPIAFSWYAAEGAAFSSEPWARHEADRVRARLERLWPSQPVRRIVMAARIGRPPPRPPRGRSVRLPLEALIVPGTPEGASTHLSGQSQSLPRRHRGRHRHGASDCNR